MNEFLDIVNQKQSSFHEYRKNLINHLYLVDANEKKNEIRSLVFYPETDCIDYVANTIKKILNS